MSVYDSIMQGLNEAVEHQRGKIKARTVRRTYTPLHQFDAQEVKNIRQKTGLSQVMFAGTLGVSTKTVEAWEGGRNVPNGSSSRMLEIVRDDPKILARFQSES